jgi:precorrin-8X/cobalt-precorrin-8 methylmutase
VTAYIRDGAEIYRRSFAIIRVEAALTRFTPAEERVAVRIIHACGMVEIAADLAFAAGAVQAGIAALEAGAPILCDSKMVANGITRTRLPRDNPVICTLDAAETPALAPPPACIIGMPVGFVGAAQSKDALIAAADAPYLTINGRKGGSAMTAAAVNALASARE